MATPGRVGPVNEPAPETERPGSDTGSGSGSDPNRSAIPPRREIFPVHSYEVDAFGILEVPALAGYLQEVAGAHAAELGVGMDALTRQGLTWVLSRQRLVIASPIALGERVEIATWPSGIDRLTALREFVVRREDGSEVARATTQWLVLDLATRRPVRPEKVLDPRFPRERSAPVAPPREGKLPPLPHWEAQRRFHVRYSDIDRNLHVNNTSYLAWSLEAVDQDLWRSSRVAEIEAQFLAEGKAGSAILSRLACRGEAEFAHAVVQEEDGRELARVITRWVGRTSGTSVSPGIAGQRFAAE